MVSGPCHRHRPKVSPNPVEPDRSRETFGQAEWHGRETMPQRGAVKIVAVGHKEHNDLYLRGEKAEL